MSAQFNGVIVAMLTPLNSEERVDHPSLRRLVEHLIAGGVDGLFILGSNGEGPSLRPAVRHELAEATVEAASGRVRVIAGALETSTARAIDEIRSLSGCGLAGYVATTPFYFGGYSPCELQDHFYRIADASKLPVLLYNIPQNTKIALKAELVLRLAEHPNIAGVKDSSGDWAEFQTILLGRRNPDFAVLQGVHQMSVVSLLAGADGLVPGYANIYPRLLTALVAAVRAHDLRAAFAHQAHLDRLLQIRGRANIHANKLLCSRMGLMQDHVTSPLPRMQEEEASRFIAASVAAGLPLAVIGALPSTG